MRRKRHSPEQVVHNLREAEAGLSAGKSVEEVCKGLGVSPQTYFRWKREYGGAKADRVKRLKEPQKENARLKAIVADLELDKRILKETLEGNY